jgi:uncharacterized protein (TIGR03435 family)
MNNSMDDHELLRQYVQSHSQEAFRELVDRHLPMVYATARRVVGDAQLAEDVAQGTFSTLAQKAVGLGSSLVVGGWLYHTTRHLALHALRTERRRREREQKATGMQFLDSESEPSRILEQLEPAMAELEDSERDALVLRYLQDRSLREVGSQLGISEDAARMRVNRALEHLRSVFAHRGVTVTSAVLATALGASTSSSLPASLAATITAAALAGETAATSPLATLAHSWLNAKAASAALGAVLLAAVGTYLVQQRQITQLRADNQTLLAQRQELSTSVETASQRVKASQDELQRLQQDNSELLRLRNEVTQLRRQQTASRVIANSASQNGVIWSLDAKVLAQNPPTVLIRPSPDSASGRAAVGMRSTDRGTIALGTYLSNIVAYAYDIAPHQLGRIQMPQETPRGQFDFLNTLPQGGREALQKLLKDQYGLTAKRETRLMECLQLFVKNAGAVGLKRSTNSGVGGHWSLPVTSSSGTPNNGIRGVGMSMAGLATQLEGKLGLTVVDQTGTTERFDYDLALNPSSSLTEIQQALYEQLGMGLEPRSQKEPVEFLVVEKIQ